MVTCGWVAMRYGTSPPGTKGTRVRHGRGQERLACGTAERSRCRVGTNKGKELVAEIGTLNWKETDD